MTTLHIVLSDLEVTHTMLAKVTLLQNKYAANVVWYLHHHQSFFERSYFYNELANLSDTLQASHQSKVKQVELKIKKHFPKADITLCNDKYWSQLVSSHAGKLDPIVIIRSKSGLTAADNQFINQNKATIFILGQEKWLSEGKAIGAIDPFHEEDKENKSDFNVFHFMRKWCPATEQNESILIHIVHIPPLAIEYDKQIETLHKEKVYRFAKIVKCPKELITFMRGTPEHTLPVYVKEHKIDLMVLGVREHSLFDKWLNGSTISALVNEQNCDLVLINTP